MNTYTFFLEKYKAMIFDEECLALTDKDLSAKHFYRFAIKHSRFGRSLVTTEHIAKGEKIACLPAIFVTDKVKKISIALNGRVEDIKLGEHLYRLLPTKTNTLQQFSHLSTFLDHACWPSCNANCDGHIWQDGKLHYTLTALHDIPAGGYVSVDYATIEYEAEPEAEMDCGCNSTHCRQRYKGFIGMPLKQQQAFMRRHMLEAPVAHAVWKTLAEGEADKFARHYKQGRPQGDQDLFEDLCNV